MNHRAAAVFEGKQQSGRFGDLDLLVIASSFQIFAAGEQGPVELRCALDGAAQDRLRGAMQFRIRGFEQNQPEVREDSREQASERIPEVAPRKIALPESGHDIALTQDLRGAIDRRADVIGKTDATDRRIRLPGSFGSHLAQREVWRGNRQVIDFSEIVIFGREPENGNSIHSSRRRFFGKLDRGKRFVEREDRTAEKAYLLSGNYGGSTRPQTRDIFQDFRRRIPAAILAFKNGSHQLASFGVVIGTRWTCEVLKNVGRR